VAVSYELAWDRLDFDALWALSGILVYAATVSIDTLIRSHRWAHEAAPYAVATTLLTAGGAGHGDR